MNGLLQRVVIPPALRGFASTAPAAQAFEVSWQEGRITRIVPVPHAPEGTLVSAPVDVHVHIDKSYTVEEVGEALWRPRHGHRADEGVPAPDGRPNRCARA